MSEITTLEHGSRHAYERAGCRCTICRTEGTRRSAELRARHRDGPLISSRRWPLQPIERFLGLMMTSGLYGTSAQSDCDGLRYTREREMEVPSLDYVTAELLGVHRHTIYRWRQDGILEPTADCLAVQRLKVHPSAIWGRAWFDVIDIEAVVA